MLFDTGDGIGAYVLGVIAAQTGYGFMYLIAGMIVTCSSALYYGLHHRKQRMEQARS